MKQKEIYVKDVCIYHIQEYEKGIWAESFSDGKTKRISKLEKIGKPFNIITPHVFEDTLSIHYQKDLIFKDMKSPLSIGKYLNLAKIPNKWSRPKNEGSQELGLIHGNPTNLSSSTEINKERIGISRSIIPCQFYLIK